MAWLKGREGDLLRFVLVLHFHRKTKQLVYSASATEFSSTNRPQVNYNQMNQLNGQLYAPAYSHVDSKGLFVVVLFHQP